MSNKKRGIRHQMDGKLFVPIVILSLIASIGLIKAKNCPALMCQCKWTNGKETAFCDNRSLDSIPIGIPVSTQVLNISDNKLKRLGAQVFRERGLINLQKIFMSKCKLGEVSDDSFLQLTNVIEIDLCDNLLENIPTMSLQKCKSLRKLWLCLNPIGVIRSDSFNNLNSLVNIDLSLCQIDSVESNAFRGLNELRYLKLDSNRLTTLAANALTDLGVLHSLDLHENRWNCDCKLKVLIDWLLNHNIPQTIWPKCQTPPHLEGYAWSEINSDEFWCSPEFHTKKTEYHSKIGQNITIECTASGCPLPSIYWKFESNQEFENKMSTYNEDRYIISFEKVNQTFAISLITINGLISDDNQKLFCLASNKGGAYYHNFSLTVDQTDKSQINSNEFGLTVYIIALIIGLIIALIICLISRLRSKRCSTIGSTRLSSKMNPIDIVQDCKNCELEMKNILSNKPEIALISDIIKETNNLKSYRFGSDALTPDVTKFGPQFSTVINNSSTTLSTSVSFETFRSTPPLLLLDSTQPNYTYNKGLNNVSLEHFSADNRFKYKKLNSFNVMNKSEANNVNECQKLLVLCAKRSGVNDMPLTRAQQSPLTTFIDREEQKHCVSHTLELDKPLLPTDSKAPTNLNSNNNTISMTRV